MYYLNWQPPTAHEKELVEECFAIEYPDGNTWPMTPDSAKRAILAAIRSDFDPACGSEGGSIAGNPLD